MTTKSVSMIWSGVQFLFKNTAFNSHTLLRKEGIRKVLENDLPLLKDGITPEVKTFH